MCVLQKLLEHLRNFARKGNVGNIGTRNLGTGILVFDIPVYRCETNTDRPGREGRDRRDRGDGAGSAVRSQPVRSAVRTARARPVRGALLAPSGRPTMFFLTSS